METELNGVEEERDGMSDEEGNEIDGVRGVSSVRLTTENRTRNKPTQREREEHEATHVPFGNLCVHCVMGWRSHSSSCCKAEV